MFKTSVNARPYCSLTSSFYRTPACIRTNLILPETRFHELHDLCYSIGLSEFHFTLLFSKAKKRCSRRALTHLTVIRRPPRGTSANIRINLIPPETRIIGLGLHVAADIMGLSHSNICGGLRKCMFSATECISAVQGHPRSLILAPIERAYATSY